MTTPRPDITVLLHQDDRKFHSISYLLHGLIAEWRKMGLDVEIIYGVRHPIRENLLIPHLDMTITPLEYRCFLEQHTNVLNPRLFDISKSRISHHLVKKEDAYYGPVIVKTDRNCGGLPERKLVVPHRIPWHMLAKILHRLKKQISERRRSASVRWGRLSFLRPADYPVFHSLQDVPAAVFQNKNLVVEKFLPERNGNYYCVRLYYCFGDKEICLWRRSETPVVKGFLPVAIQEVEVPDEIHTLRRELNLDYAKIDFVVRDDRVIVFDINRTPADNVLRQSGLLQEAIDRLKVGIHAIRESANQR